MSVCQFFHCLGVSQRVCTMPQYVESLTKYIHHHQHYRHLFSLHVCLWISCLRPRGVEWWSRRPYDIVSEAGCHFTSLFHTRKIHDALGSDQSSSTMFFLSFVSFFMSSRPFTQIHTYTLTHIHLNILSLLHLYSHTKSRVWIIEIQSKCLVK